LARHSTITLTMDVYTHVSTTDLAGVVEGACPSACHEFARPGTKEHKETRERKDEK
jgi:hypothetical protein